MKNYKREFKDYSAVMWVDELRKSYADFEKALDYSINKNISEFNNAIKYIKNHCNLRKEAEENKQGILALIACGYICLSIELKEHWESFNASDKSFVLAFKPEYAKDFNDWDKLYPFNWQFLLGRQPQFIKEAENHISGWAGILSIKPELFNKTTIWQKFSKDDWFTLLQSQPQFISHCPYINKFNKFEKQRLIRKHPNLSKIILNYGNNDV